MSNFRHVYFLKYKSDVLECFKEYKRMIENKFGRPMKVLRSDNDREYYNSDMKQYLASRGIRMENTAPYTPEQNGRSERDNRTIVESARTMIHAKNLPLSLWAEAVNTAIYVLNRTTSSRNSNATPYEIWVGKKPSLSHLRMFESEAYLHINKQFRQKFDPKAKKVLLVGYQGDSANYRLYDPKTRSVSVSRDVVFNEKAQGEELSTGETRVDKITFTQQEYDSIQEEAGAGDNQQPAIEQRNL